MPIAIELTLTYAAGSGGPSGTGGFGPGAAGDLRLVVWVRGIALGAARAAVVAMGTDDAGQPWRRAVTVPFSQLLPMAAALTAAHWPSPNVEDGMDSSDLWQQARLVGQVDEADGNVVLAGMAVGFNGPDARNLRTALGLMLDLAGVNDTQARWFLTGLVPVFIPPPEPDTEPPGPITLVVEPGEDS